MDKRREAIVTFGQWVITSILLVGKKNRLDNIMEEQSGADRIDDN